MKTLEKTTAADTTQRINISWELAEQCKAPAAAQGMSVRDYIRQTLHSAILHRLNPDEGNTKAVLPTENKTTATATMPSRKTKEVTIPIPRQHFEAFSVFANHFGLTPEMVMNTGSSVSSPHLGTPPYPPSPFSTPFPPW